MHDVSTRTLKAAIGTVALKYNYMYAGKPDDCGTWWWIRTLDTYYQSRCCLLHSECAVLRQTTSTTHDWTDSPWQWFVYSICCVLVYDDWCAGAGLRDMSATTFLPIPWTDTCVLGHTPLYRVTRALILSTVILINMLCSVIDLSVPTNASIMWMSPGQVVPTFPTQGSQGSRSWPVLQFVGGEIRSHDQDCNNPTSWQLGFQGLHQILLKWINCHA